MIELRAMSNIDSRKLFSPYFVGFNILINKKQIDGLMIRGLKDHYPNSNDYWNTMELMFIRGPVYAIIVV